MRFGWMLIPALLLAIPVRGEQEPQVRFEFSNPSLYPAQWSLELHPDGSGHFQAEGGSRAIRAGIPGDVRELGPGDQAAFELSGGRAR